MKAKELTGLLEDNPLAKTMGTFSYGFVTVLSTTCLYPARDLLSDLIHESLENKRSHGLPHFTPYNDTFWDEWGEAPYIVGIASAVAVELAGIGYTADRLYHGDFLNAALYPAAKVVTNGLAWIVKNCYEKGSSIETPTVG